VSPAGPGADDGEIDFLRRAVTPDARLAGQPLQGGILEDPAVAAINDRGLSRRAQGREHPPTRFRFRVEPCERDEVLVKELADRAGGAAASGADHAQAQLAHLGQQLPAAREGEDQLLPETRYAVEQRPELAVRDTEQSRRPLRDGRDDHRPAGQDVDVPGEVARFVDRDQTVGVGRVADLQPAGFDHEQVDVRLTGPKNDIAVGVVARLGQGFDERQLGAGEAREGGLFRLSHGVIPDGARTHLAG